MLRTYLSTKFVELSHFICSTIEENEGWENLAPFPTANIIKFTLDSLDLWRQLINYRSNEAAKAINFPGLIDPVNNNMAFSEFKEKEGEFYEIDIFEEERLTKNSDNKSLESNFNLDVLLIAASCLLCRIVTERTLPYLEQNNSSNLNQLIDIEKFQALLLANEAPKKQGIQVAERFEMDDDYDFDEEENQKVDNIILPQDLVTEISKLDFSLDPSKALRFLPSNEEVYHDIFLDEKVVDKLASIKSKELLLDQLNERLSGYILKKAQIAERKLVEISCKASSSKETIKEEKTGSPIFNCEKGPLKFLMGMLNDKHKDLLLSKNNLKTLIDEVKEDGSHSGSRGFKGELYDSFERIVQDLIDLKDHSYPFLNPVQRKSAPDYHKVISCPMDLSTVSKKIKARKYANKKEFASDLFLIYTNCRTYNTAEGNEYLIHADAMEEYTKELLTGVPSEFSRPKKTFDRSSAPRRSSKASIKGPFSPSSSIALDHELDFGPNLDSKESEQGSIPPMISNSEQDIDSEIQEVEIQIKLVEKKIAKERYTINPLDDPQTEIWNSVTRETRAYNNLVRFALSEVDFDNCPAIIPGSSPFKSDLYEQLASMPFYSDGRDPFENPSSLKPKSILANFHHESQAIGKLAPERKAISELSLSGNVPEITQYFEGVENYLDSEYVEETHVKKISLSDFSSARVPNGNASRQFLQNIAELKCTQEMHDKIGIAEEFLGDDLAGAHNAEVLKSTIRYLSSDTQPKTDDLYNLISNQRDSQEEPELDSFGANEICKRTSALLLMNAGFDSVQPQALDVFSELVGQHLENLGRTMRTYMDLHGDEMTSEEILLHTLNENKASSLEDLEEYIYENVEKQTSRLQDVREKLKVSFNTVISRPGGSGLNEDGEINFDDGVESFMAGNFEDITGDDFFGFKELGLDRELGLESLSVPAKLLLGHKRQTFLQPVNGASSEVPPDFIPPSAFSPVQNLDQLIAPLKSFYTERMNDSSIQIEDEFAPTRKSIKPKAPPIGKQAIALRRKLVEVEVQTEAKRFKKAKDSEEKARRKKEKEKEMDEKRKVRKAEQLARAEAKAAEKEVRRLAREAQSLKRKAELEAKRAAKSNTNSETPATHHATVSPSQFDDDESLNMDSSPKVSTSPIASSASSPTSESSTSSDDNDIPLAVSHKATLVRKNPHINGRSSGQKRPRVAQAPSVQQEASMMNKYTSLITTSEESSSDSDSDSHTIHSRPAYPNPSRNGSSNHSRPTTQINPNLKPRKKPTKQNPTTPNRTARRG